MGHLKVSIAAFMVFTLHSLTGGAQNVPPLNDVDQTISITQGHTATLHAASAGAVAFQWLKDGSFIAGAIQNNYVVSTGGKYQVLSTNAANCSSELSAPVIVTIAPPDGDAGADMMITLKSSQQSTNLSDPITYTITIKNNGPVTATGINIQDILPPEVQFLQLMPPMKGTANYSDITKNISWLLDQLASGETVTLTFTVMPLKAGEINNTATVTAVQADPNPDNNIATTLNTAAGLTIPNVFTPNGDGVNDAFVIPGLEAYTENEFTVMNRWGAVVYKKQQYKNDWDGSGLNEGTYFYLLKTQSSPGKWDIYKGYLTLLRSKK